MSFLFGSSQPQAQTVPVSPDTSTADAAARQLAADTAIAEQKSRGRRSTIVGGMQLAEDQQQARAAGKTVLG